MQVSLLTCESLKLWLPAEHRIKTTRLRSFEQTDYLLFIRLISEVRRIFTLLIIAMVSNKGAGCRLWCAVSLEVRMLNTQFGFQTTRRQSSRYRQSTSTICCNRFYRKGSCFCDICVDFGLEVRHSTFVSHVFYFKL